MIEYDRYDEKLMEREIALIDYCSDFSPQNNRAKYIYDLIKSFFSGLSKISVVVQLKPALHSSKRHASIPNDLIRENMARSSSNGSSIVENAKLGLSLYKSISENVPVCDCGAESCLGRNCLQ